MTTQDYAKYQAAVDRFLTVNRVRPGCHCPTDPEQEPSFSWRPCECCARTLGGNRENYSFAYEPNGKGMLGRQDKGPHTFEARICTDCVYYLAYGQLDDLTMMDMVENG